MSERPDRRRYLAVATDAIMAYWLGGTHDPDMAVWWTTDEAVDAAGEMFTAVMEGWEHCGLAVPWMVTDDE